MRADKKRSLLQRRRWRIRKKISGTESCPRMSVRMTHKNIYVQFVNDELGRTMASVSSRDKNVENREKLAANIDGAKQIGKLAGEAAKAAGIETAVFDRSGARYHGKVKALAEAVREAGLKI
ncbi:MAG: 50S ribosomal protein L18 [Verrucomicrobiota bacterium]|nr:50S ribosomal protein L18 [Verrucomicrobiota bacterium]|tara:strand:+ start:184 stop:549 length:366 start_codon:yes stop_codon:yes gene_type:complete